MTRSSTITASKHCLRCGDKFLVHDYVRLGDIAMAPMRVLIEWRDERRAMAREAIAGMLRAHDAVCEGSETCG